MEPPLLEVRELSMSYRQAEGWLPVLRGVSFDIARGEAFGLVGESGCGKSTVALQLLGFRPPQARIDGGSVRFDGQDLLRLGRRALDRLRGGRIAFVPQNPTTALNPGMRVGAQIAEVLLRHGKSAGRAAAEVRTAELFALVGLPQPDRVGRRFPHQLSGGQQQRVCIAMALACDPDLVVLDEPTTGLDVTTQEQIVALLDGLRTRIRLAMLYVTHDLGLLSQIADRVGVMYAGHMVEIAPTATLFRHPRHPYTRGLIGSIPRIGRPEAEGARPLRGLLRRQELPTGCPFQPRCDFAEAACAGEPQVLEPVAPGQAVACRRWRRLPAPTLLAEVPRRPPAAGSAETPLLALERVTLAYGGGGRLARLLGQKPGFVAVRDLDLAIGRGETLALVGESGSGKSTVARAVSGLLRPTEGRVLFEGRPLAGEVRRRSAQDRRRIQYIFQNPDASLNPRARIGAILARPLQHFFRLGAAEQRQRVAAALQDVRLDASYARRFSDQLSGGERQRVAIARALVAEPELLICDEILSALDVSVQANVRDLLRRLRSEHGIAMLFISHDLAVVRLLADRVGVLFHGQLMELGPTEAVFQPPWHPYTLSLLLAVPDPDRPRRPAAAPARRGPATGTPTGCAFAGRCPWQPGELCETAPPPLRRFPGALQIRCHLPPEELHAIAGRQQQALGAAS